ncbi:hypothetical protein E6H32_03950 [Candidatus Bathyarchaeota archaeon]|nr:MAG: hypothetical protein E6H32_03950 [Candidatus Bathyarchaeota archaeon]
MIPKRFEIATVLLLLAPLSSGFGLWLIFQAGILVGSNAADMITVAETGVGVLFFILGFPLFFTSIGVFASKESLEAQKWVHWLGRLNPKIENGDPSPVSSAKGRVYAMVILLVVFIQAILLIPGIGEDRLYPLNQFYGLLGSLWYFYVLATGLSGFILIYYRRIGGYIPAIIMMVLSIGTTVPDVLGLLPPSAPTLRTTVLMLSVLPLAIPLVYVSWKALHVKVSEPSSSKIATPPDPTKARCS